MLEDDSHLRFMRTIVQTLVASIFLASLLCSHAAMAQQPRSYPAFTLVMRSTEYDTKGEIVYTSTHTRYESSSGDWRSVGKVADYEVATLYLRGRGVYQANSRTARTIKQSDHAPGCLLRTSAQLQGDPKFTRTEIVLGFTTYVLSQRPTQDILIESYFVPELGGGTPFKQVTTLNNGLKVVSEPISVPLGEPAAREITGPDYLVIEQVPAFNNKISDKLLSKPDAVYPVEALAQGLSGDVKVAVTVDETGRVIVAGTGAGAGPPSLREAAVEAAYQALFTPTICNGAVVPASGYISYQFVPPK